MIISDLNHIEVVNEETNIVGGLYRTVNFYDRKDININENIYIRKNVNSYVNLRGNLATAEATADATGYNTIAETFTDAVSSSYGSSAISFSVAGTDQY
ncbi:MAG: hypothetical protein F6K55_19540 [Moorea sp. SIO4A3]|nr:hypothetical protein [Moorena sp. SIO4A3]NEO46198.1 hypothetical protein [Moorena sp. SIO4A3]